MSELFDAFTHPAVDPGVFHEVVDPDGTVRSHWRQFINSISQLGPEDLKNRWEHARRILSEHGVTYNVYSDAHGSDRPWRMDLIPLILGSGEWRHLERGLIQRARLLNEILRDLYGPGVLVRNRLLPPTLLHGNPAFLRSCHGIVPPNERFLSFLAVDLARTPDGQWWAIADRTQSPSGAGYALENRIVLSRVLPDEFRDIRVQRLAGFFRVERDAVRALAPRNRDQPNVVLLTPGPHNEAYFEHAYLARYLGFQLVEGADLSVRDRRVFVKTLDGLQPVDVILRRLDDSFCDPLELRADSMLGIPGLVEAARAGNVAVANALGSGLVESPAFLPYLPALSQHLLGEPLLLPSVPTRWCGNPPDLHHVQSHLQSLVIKRAFRAGSSEAIFGDRLDERKRARLIEDLAAHPADFVGQEQLTLSQAPVWSEGHLRSHPLVLRAFVAADGPGFTVMPGGLTRIARSPRDPFVSIQAGTGSKDTWVIADGPISTVTLLQSPSHGIQPERVAAEIPSRVADNLFWLGRYSERLEGTLRLLGCALRQLSIEAGREPTPERITLTRLLIGLELLPSALRPDADAATLEKELLSLVYLTSRDGGIHDIVRRIHYLFTVVRDRFSTDAWRVFNQLHADSQLKPRRLPLAAAIEGVHRLLTDLAAFSGLEMENMTRGLGWRFLDIGKRLERASHATAMLRAAVTADPATQHILDFVLEIADSRMTYRRRYFSQPRLPTVLHLLVHDDSNPRSLAFQLEALAEHLARLPGDPRPASLTLEQRLVGAMQARLRNANLNDLSEEITLHQSSGRLDALLDSISIDLFALSDDLTQRFFRHVATQVSGAMIQ